MAYRTEVLRRVGGFDERFPRAHREDADLALRLLDAGWRIRRGRRTTLHPVRPASRWASVGKQRGHADDALMRRLHGPDWWERAVSPRGRIRRHAAITAAWAAACALAVTGHRRAAAPARRMGGRHRRVRPRPYRARAAHPRGGSDRARHQRGHPARRHLAPPGGAWRHRNAPAWREVAR